MNVNNTEHIELIEGNSYHIHDGYTTTKDKEFINNLIYLGKGYDSKFTGDVPYLYFLNTSGVNEKLLVIEEYYIEKYDVSTRNNRSFQIIPSENRRELILTSANGEEFNKRLYLLRSNDYFKCLETLYYGDIDYTISNIHKLPNDEIQALWDFTINDKIEFKVQVNDKEKLFRLLNVFKDTLMNRGVNHNGFVQFKLLPESGYDPDSVYYVMSYRAEQKIYFYDVDGHIDDVFTMHYDEFMKYVILDSKLINKKNDDMENKYFNSLDELFKSNKIDIIKDIDPVMFDDMTVQFTNCKLVAHSNGDEIFLVQKMNSSRKDDYLFLRTHYEAERSGTHTNVYFTEIMEGDMLNMDVRFGDIEKLDIVAFSEDVNKLLVGYYDSIGFDNPHFEIYYRALAKEHFIDGDNFVSVRLALDNNLKLNSIDTFDMSDENKKAIRSEFISVLPLFESENIVKIDEPNKPKFNIIPGEEVYIYRPGVGFSIVSEKGVLISVGKYTARVLVNGKEEGFILGNISKELREFKHLNQELGAPINVNINNKDMENKIVSLNGGSEKGKPNSEFVALKAKIIENGGRVTEIDSVQSLINSGEIQKMDHIAPMVFGEYALTFTNCQLYNGNNGDVIYVVKKLGDDDYSYLKSHYEPDPDHSSHEVYFVKLEELDNLEVNFKYIDIKEVNDLAYHYNVEYDFAEKLDMEMQETYVDNDNDLSYDMFFRQLCIAHTIDNRFIDNVKMALDNNLKLNSIDPNDMSSVNKMAISSEFTKVVTLLGDIQKANFKPQIQTKMENEKEKSHPQNYQYVRGYVSNLKTLENGMVSFSVGYPKYEKPVEGKEKDSEKEAEWINIRVMAQAKTAEKAPELKVGDLVECSGQSEFTSYKDKNTQKEQYTNTLWLGKVVVHDKEKSKEKGYSENYMQPYNNVILLKGELKDKAFNKVFENGVKHSSAILDNVVKYKDATDAWQEKRSDVRIEGFGKSSEAMSGVNMIKGVAVELSGVVEPKAYTDKDGDMRYTVGVNVVGIELQKEKVKEATQGR